MAFLTEIELEEMKKRLNATTGGPWQSFIEGRDCESGSSFIRTFGNDLYLTGVSEADQDFIAASHQDIPKLIAEIARLRTLISALEKK